MTKYWGTFFDEKYEDGPRRGSMTRLMVFCAFWAALACAAATVAFLFKNPKEVASAGVIAAMATMFAIKFGISLALKSVPPEAGNGPSSNSPTI